MGEVRLVRVRQVGGDGYDGAPLRARKRALAEMLMDECVGLSRTILGFPRTRSA